MPAGNFIISYSHGSDKRAKIVIIESERVDNLAPEDVGLESPFIVYAVQETDADSASILWKNDNGQLTVLNATTLDEETILAYEADGYTVEWLEDFTLGTSRAFPTPNLYG